MRFSEAWLRQYVNPTRSTQELVNQLTMAGLEVDSVAPAAGEFSGVVVGEIIAADPHPEADRLRVCTVNVGTETPLQIVCGAPNARLGLKAPLAREGACLPGDLKIKSAKLRGIPSFGMLCSAKELGIDEDSSGLMELAEDAPVGEDLRTYLALDDTLVEVDLTPNRADCLSVEGIAREVALLNGLPLNLPEIKEPIPAHASERAVELTAPEACPRYLGRLIQDVNRNAPTPLWMKERLRRSGVRSLDVIVDITNYVLLELGQPLHAFDADTLQGTVYARWARPGERLALLNGQEITLDGETLVIADDQGPQALAGIMGGSATAVGPETRNIFLECAFFTPDRIMGKARRYGLSTDSSHRFERGVSFTLQHRAIQRATDLILTLAGGQVGPLTERISPEHLPSRQPIRLRAQRIEKLLGLNLPDEAVLAILNGLGMHPDVFDGGWEVIPPPSRFDITLEADLIEEIGRVHGYDRLPRRNPMIPAQMRAQSERTLDLDRIKDTLVDRGYQEVITYSFVEAGLQREITPDQEPLALKNPLSQELAVMRTSLWPGLLDTAVRNLRRQQTRIRLFESGLRFIKSVNGLEQIKTLAWLVSGDVDPEQWGQKSRRVDFFDIKSEVEALVALTGRHQYLAFEPASHAALHPGQTARILLEGKQLGFIGLLHPLLEKKLGLDQPTFLVEIDQDSLLERALPRFQVLSRYPSMRRDIALIVGDEVQVADLVHTAQDAGGVLLQEVVVFDVYRGPGVEAGRKSVALGLIWQDDAETLVDARVDQGVKIVLDCLASGHGAKLRD